MQIFDIKVCFLTYDSGLLYGYVLGVTLKSKHQAEA